MKKKIGLLIIVLLSFVMLPITTNAASKSDKVTVYMFRGQGCGYCRAFLTFLSNINEEYGKYFELESYEVWYDSNNGELMSKLSKFMNQEAKGVPYIIIGDKVFAGYASSYDSQIKSAIKDLYETKKSERYDVIKEYEKTEKLTKKYKSKNLKETLAEEDIEYKEYNSSSSSSSSTSSKSVILWNLLFITFATLVVLFFVNKKINVLEDNLAESLKKITKTNKK